MPKDKGFDISQAAIRQLVELQGRHLQNPSGFLAAAQSMAAFRDPGLEALMEVMSREIDSPWMDEGAAQVYVGARFHFDDINPEFRVGREDTEQFCRDLTPQLRALRRIRDNPSLPAFTPVEEADRIVKVSAMSSSIYGIGKNLRELLAIREKVILADGLGKGHRIAKLDYMYGVGVIIKGIQDKEGGNKSRR